MSSNITFASNVNIIRSTSQRKGDTTFLNKVTDYDALYKLRNICGGSTNSYFYMFTSKQLKIVSPDFAYGCMNPEIDKEIAEENELRNQEYGYDSYEQTRLFPLLDELQLDYGKSIWDISGGFFWARPGFYSDGNVSEISYWKEANKQKGTVEVYGGGSLFTSYIKQELEQAKNTRDDYIPVDQTEFPELDELDPYYYRYKETAGVRNE